VTVHISFTQTATSYTTDHNSFLNCFFYMKNGRVFYAGAAAVQEVFLSAVRQTRAFHVLPRIFHPSFPPVSPRVGVTSNVLFILDCPRTNVGVFPSAVVVVVVDHRRPSATLSARRVAPEAPVFHSAYKFFRYTSRVWI